MTTDEINRIIETLGTGEHSYYVYVLCIDSVPCYVGKGHGHRMLNHLDAALLAQETIDSDDTLSDEEKKTKTSQMSEKIQTILGNQEHIEEVIVKWGLTEHEALMCESSLINLLGFCQGKEIAPLTNIVNGHASSAEKESVADVKTKARTTAQFLRECAIESRDISRTAYRIAFIKINSTYLGCMDADGIPDDGKIRESVRGFWKISKARRMKIQYIFALYKRRVVGIYHVTGISDELGRLNGEMDGFPSFPKHARTMDKLVSQYATIQEAQLGLNADDYRDFLKALSHNGKMPQKALDAWRKRVYFIVDDNVPDELLQFKDTMITKDGSPRFFSVQAPVVFNF